MSALKTAILCFSLTGRSARIARKLSTELGMPMIMIKAPAYRSGLFGYLRAGFDSLRQHCVLPSQSFGALDRHDLVVLCGPVWTSYPSTPLRAVLRGQFGRPSRVGLFLTSGSHSAGEKAFSVAENDLGRALAVKALLENGTEDTVRERTTLNDFVAELRRGMPALQRA